MTMNTHPAAPAARAGERRLVAVPTAPRHIGKRPRTIHEPALPLDHPLATGRYQTPLRYPGAKTGLANLIGQLVESAKTSPQVRRVDLLVEPFAGGASTSLRLVGAGIVDRILLADADPLVAAFWQVAASHTEALIDRMIDEHTVHIAPGGATALQRWDHWRQWTPPPGMSVATARFEAAVKCLILNRTTFSGILHGRAGPIGGRKQESPYGIGCRFNVNALTERIRYIGHLYNTHRLIDVWCKDWMETLADVPEWYPHLIPDNVVAYLDPPYLEKSKKLYQRSFDPQGAYASAPTNDLEWSRIRTHYRLAEYLRRKIRFRWILSYDAHPALLAEPSLYAANRMTPTTDDKNTLHIKDWRITKRLVSLHYTASARQGRGPANELLITTLPPTKIPINQSFRTLDNPRQQPQQKPNDKRADGQDLIVCPVIPHPGPAKRR
jgi:DNA adenine methylase